MSFQYHLITNTGTLASSDFAKDYKASLCLSQLYEKDDDYRRGLKHKRARGHRLILDNGAHEGFDVDLEAYLSVAADLNPSVVVLTDLVGRHNLDSRERSLKFVRMAHSARVLTRSKFMYVSQGENEDQVLNDYHWALANLDPVDFVIGLGQGYLCWVKSPDEVNREATRIPMIEAVMAMPHANEHEFHVLGARWSSDESDYARFDRITGIDTIKPCTCAWAGMVYPRRPTFRSIPRDSSDRVDEELLVQNVQAFCDEYGCEL